MTAAVAILLSGRGSNFLALHDAVQRGEIPARIVLVLSNVIGAPGVERAADLGLPTIVIPHAGQPSRAAHEREVLAALAASGAEWVCLAGYMRLLSSEFVRHYERRILNVHPSLLPAFPGLGAQHQALLAGVKLAGCTVHFVDEGLDSGPIVAQRAVPVRDDDDEASLAARILVEEHRAYPEALGRLLAGGWRISGRRVLFERGGSPASGS
jgi:phosphoribosylglycinamide formyltransferase-1